MMFLFDAVCLAFLCACFCRLYKLNPGEDKISWGVMYGLVFTGDMCLWAEVRNGDHDYAWAVGFFFLAWILNFWLTHKQWLKNNGAPDITKKDPPPKHADPAPVSKEYAAMHYPLARVASMEEIVEHIP